MAGAKKGALAAWESKGAATLTGFKKATARAVLIGQGLFRAIVVSQPISHNRPQVTISETPRPVATIAQATDHPLTVITARVFPVATITEAAKPTTMITETTDRPIATISEVKET
jgi:hypothetical protein